MKVKGIRSVGESDLEVRVRGPEITRIFELAGDVARAAGTASNVTNVRLSLDMTKPEYQVRPDRLRAASMGVSAADIATSLQGLLRGHVPTLFREGEESYAVRLMVPEASLSSRADIESLPLSCTDDGCLRVRDVAKVFESTGPVEIVRMDQVKQVVVQADASGASVGAAQASLRSALANVPLDPGYELSYGGQAQMMGDARDTLLRIVAFALFFSLVVLIVQFNRLRVPLIILGTVPFSLAGLGLLLWVTGVPMGATVVIGLLVVVAANVTEGVLLLTYAEEIRVRDDLSPARAVLQAARIRFRPRVMTLLGITIGFLPIALNLEEGGDMLKPMAVGAIGGLLAGAAVALYLMPLLYSRFAGQRGP
jgi:multidrug efflux pump subunit AcrB